VRIEFWLSLAIVALIFAMVALVYVDVSSLCRKAQEEVGGDAEPMASSGVAADNEPREWTITRTETTAASGQESLRAARDLKGARP
jgi:hypothetical protein